MNNNTHLLPVENVKAATQFMRSAIYPPPDVQGIREQIQAGTYDVDGAKFGVASDRLIDEVLRSPAGQAALAPHVPTLGTLTASDFEDAERWDGMS